MNRIGVAPLTAMLIAMATSAVAAELESFRFWPQKGASTVPGFEELQDHPCGEVASAKVAKLPTFATGPLRPEFVFELNRRGEVIRKWPMPVDFVPAAVNGAELLVALADRAFWVSPDGSYRRETRVLKDNSVRITCNLKRVFGASGYGQCARLMDLSSDRSRTIAFEGPCT